MDEIGIDLDRLDVEEKPQEFLPEPSPPPGPAPTDGVPGVASPGPAPTDGVPGVAHPGPAPTDGVPGVAHPGPAPTDGVPGVAHPGPAPTNGVPGVASPGPSQPQVDFAASPSLMVGAPLRQETHIATGATNMGLAASPMEAAEGPDRKRRHATRGQKSVDKNNKNKSHWIKRTWLRRTVKITVSMVAVAAVLIASLLGYAYYRYSQVKKVDIPAIVPINPAINPGENILLVGTDTLSPQGPEAGSGSGSSLPGARTAHADVIMLFHLDLTAGRASVLSIPPLLEVSPNGQSGSVTLDSLYGSSPQTLVSAISSVFSIPVNHFVSIDYAGIQQLVSSLGGLRLRFNYPVRDRFSGLNIARTGCQLINGTTALELLRSTDYEYESGFSWVKDPTGSFGVAQRQRTVLGAMGSRAVAAGITNPITGNRFVGSLVNDVTLDSTFSFPSLFSLVNRLNSANLAHAATYAFSTYVVNGPDGTLLLDYDPSTAEQVVAQFLGAPPGSTPVQGTLGGSQTTVTAVAGQSQQPTFFDPSSC